MERRILSQSTSHYLLGILGLLGTLMLIVSNVTSQWYNSKGLWEIKATDKVPTTYQTVGLQSNQVQEAKRFFAGLSFIMAIAGFCICLIFLFCLWPPRPTRSNFPMPRPGGMLLAALMSTGFFFLVAWALFTLQHWEEIQSDWIGLGSSYWLGATAWTTLLLLLPIPYLMDEWVALEDHKPVQV